MFKRKIGKRQAADAMGGALGDAGMGRGAAGVEPLHLSGVSLLTSTEKGPVSIPDLGLSFDAAGVTVAKGTGEVVKVVPWDHLTGLATEAQPPGANGQGVLLRVSAGERSHRFVVPAADPGAFENQVAGVARHYRSQPAPHPQASPPPGYGPVAGAPPTGAMAAVNGPVPPLASPAVGPSPAQTSFLDSRPESAPGAFQPEASPTGAHHPGGPAMVGAAASAGVMPERELAGRRKKHRGRRWALGILLVVVAAAAGLYFAQRQGYIHVLPDSIVSSPSTTAAPVVSPAPAQNVPIPGLPISVLTTEMQAQGFTCAAAPNGFYSCTRPANDVVVHVDQTAGSVGLVSATSQLPASSPKVQSVFQTIVTLPYTGSQPQSALAWLDSHLSGSGRTVIGAAQMSLVVLPNSSSLQLSAVRAPA